MSEVDCAEVVEVVERGHQRASPQDCCQEGRGSVERQDRRQEAEEKSEIDPEEDLLALVVPEGDHIEAERWPVNGALPIATSPVLRVANQAEVLPEVWRNVSEERAC